MNRLTSLTIVSVVHDEVVSAESFSRLIAALETDVADFDVVLVANAVGAATTLRLKALLSVVPDTTAVLLGERVHDDVARLVGIEHAVGDYVLFCDLGSDDPSMLPALLPALHAGYDLVVGERHEDLASRRSLPFRAFARTYAAMTGIPLEDRPTGLRIMSRAAALFVAGRPNAEWMLRARDIGPSFPATEVALPRDPAAGKVGAAHRQSRHSWSSGVGMVLSVSTLPLRSASYAALLGGVLSSFYSLYVFAVYFLKPDVAAGWTTISLQLAAMMFIFSVILLFIGEYVIQIHSANPPANRRSLVLREFRSPLSRRSALLNIVDADGRFQLGRPDWLTPDEMP